MVSEQDLLDKTREAITTLWSARAWMIRDGRDQATIESLTRVGNMLAEIEGYLALRVQLSKGDMKGNDDMASESDQALR